MTDYKLVPAGRVKTVGGYPDESEHTVEWLCKYKDLKDGDLLYTTPQPAERQPDPISRNLRAVHAMILSALDRDAADGKAVRGEIAAELRSALSEQQPALDVSALVELLAEARDHVVSSTQPVRGGFIVEIDTAIAAYHKKGDV